MDLKWWLGSGVYFKAASPACVCPPFSVTRVRACDFHRWPFPSVPPPVERKSGWIFFLLLIRDYNFLDKRTKCINPRSAWRLHVLSKRHLLGAHHPVAGPCWLTCLTCECFYLDGKWAPLVNKAHCSWGLKNPRLFLFC